MLMRFVCRSALFTSMLLLLVSGCSDNKTADVSGVVSVDGQPVEKGNISLFPADGKGPSVGGDIVNGKYEVSKAPVGTVKVQIRVPKVTGKKKLYDTPDSPTRDTFSESLPKKYNDNTELTYDVKPGKNIKDWDLSTK